jgi:hypothetical protein
MPLQADYSRDCACLMLDQAAQRARRADAADGTRLSVKRRGLLRVSQRELSPNPTRTAAEIKEAETHCTF